MGCYLFHKDRNVDPKLPRGVETCQSVIMIDRYIAADATSVARETNSERKQERKQNRARSLSRSLVCRVTHQSKRKFVVCAQSLHSEE